MKRLLLFPLILFVLHSLSAQDNQTSTPQWRSLYHFTPLKNWTNDPNGLIYINGTYHLYNQQNPFENKWGHMSWGHATSKDLVHWKHLPVAMPEAIENNNRDTTWRFSGCAVMDRTNSSGFCKGDSCIVILYTADQPNLKKESQFVAYSNDGGMHFTNYAGNPVIDLHMKDFRDPNVTWNKQLKKWLMVVALPHENKVQFYSSANLTNWKLLSEFGPAGLSGGIWECPFFIQLPVKGQPAKTKWVLVTSFANSQKVSEEYFIGDFDGTTFKNDSPADTALLVDEGDCFYAAIPWNNLPGGKKTYIGWMVPPAQETYPWRGQMSIPRDLSLQVTKSGTRLYQAPTAIIKNNLMKLSANNFTEIKNVTIDGAEQHLLKEKMTAGNAYWIKAELNVDPNANAGLNIAVRKGDHNNIVSQTKIGYDAVKHEIYIDRTHSGNGKIDTNFLKQTASVSEVNDVIILEILLDKSSLEVFINNGEKVFTTYIFPDKNADLLSAFSLGGKTLIKSLKIWNLSSIKQ